MSSRVRCLSLLLPIFLLAINLQAQRRGGGGGGAVSANHTPVVDYTLGPRLDTPTSPIVNTVHEGSVTFSAQTELVQIPVIVKDKKTGQPIDGLKKEDFKVEENGKDQAIASFEEVKTSNDPIAPLKPGQQEYTNVLAGGPQPRRISIILVDTVNTPLLDQSYSRAQLVKYLADHVNGSDLLALAVLDDKGVHVIHDFTSDPAALIAAAKKVATKFSTMSESDINHLLGATDNDGINVVGTPGSLTDTDTSAITQFINSNATEAAFRQGQAIATTMNGFLALAQAYTGVPGRKSLIWLTGGLPFEMEDAASVPGYGLAPLYERVLQAMNDANISIYPIDARGLVGYGFGGEASPVRGPLGRAMLDRNRGLLETDIHFNMQEFADMSGGRAFYNRNDLDAGLNEAQRDGATYYMLGYYLNEKNRNAGWRKLKVSVDRKDIRIQARSGFFVTASTTNFQDSRTMDLLSAMNSPLEATGLPLAVRWLGEQNQGDKPLVKFVIGSVPRAVGVDPKNHLSVDVGIRVLANSTGAPVAEWGRTLNTDLKPDSIAMLEKQGFGYPGELQLAPGNYTVRVVVRDNTSGRLGSVTAPLSVK